MENYKIIVAYDFQELSNAALKQSYELAKFVDSGIMLVVTLNDDLLSLSSSSTDNLQTGITARLKEVADNATAESGVKVDFRIETGKIYEPVLRIATENKARFILMGRTSKESDKGGFGSISRQIVEQAPCPVITLSSVSGLTEFKNVVLPIDLTKQTREEVFNAISLGLFFDATIHLVSIVMGGIPERKSRIYKKMQGMKKMIEENGVRCTEKLFKKSHFAVHEMILGYAKEIDADALMIMTHQEISTYDTYIGAVAHQIIKAAGIPVISLTSAAAMYKRSEKTSYWFSKLFTNMN
jgi:nucleotide-binding universal stress UspA family protein